MSNMSYCRFQNTDRDLQDCEIALDELINGQAEEPLSSDELDAAKTLASRCLRIVKMLADVAGNDVSLEDAEQFDDVLDGINVIEE